MVTNHLQYVEDPNTKQQWNDLVCNGIISVRPVNAKALATMLDNQVMNQMGHLANILFEQLPVLKYYYKLTKINLKSFHVKRLNPPSDINKLLSQIKARNEQQVQTPKKVQTTLTQQILTKPGTDDDEVLINMIEVNMDNFEGNSPSKTSVKKKSNKKQKDKLVINIDNNNDGFIQPKNQIPFAAVGQKYNKTFATVSATEKNTFTIMSTDVATELDITEEETQQETTKEDNNDLADELNRKKPATTDPVVKKPDDKEESDISYSTSKESKESKDSI